METVAVLDTTLRDGEQAPGIALTMEQKLLVAEGLADLAVDIVEAGFPSSSVEEFETVAQIARTLSTRNPGCTVTALARCVPDDIIRTAAALRHGSRPRLHIVLSTSRLHRQMMHAGIGDAQFLDMVARSVEQARGLVPEVQFSAQDASRTHIDFLVEVARTARDAGADVFNICDTVGFAVPDEFGILVRSLARAVPGIVYSVHCHDDLGLALANSVAGLVAGARQVEVTINGIGERAGNCSHEELVMLLRTRGAALNLVTQAQPLHFARLSALVADFTGYPVAPNKAIVGANAFRHESGLHQHGVLADRETYEVLRAEDVGRDGAQIVLGKHSGRHALRAALESIQLSVDDSRLSRMLGVLKAHPEFADDLHGLAARVSS